MDSQSESLELKYLKLTVLRVPFHYNISRHLSKNSTSTAAGPCFLTRAHTNPVTRQIFVESQKSRQVPNPELPTKKPKYKELVKKPCYRSQSQKYQEESQTEYYQKVKQYLSINDNQCIGPQ